ncbi:hypothetical protein B566_EDAN009773 [Ephemera danica]|nr:hypothetical protein B566_EDAN009773 [Ephemera danica]
MSGRPAPRVSWWGPGDELLDATDQAVGERRVSNSLQLRALSRDQHGRTYTCRASNSRLSRPLSADITVEMHREYQILNSFSEET